MFKLTSRTAVALALGTMAFSTSAVAAPPTQLFPFFVVPQTQYAPPPAVVAPSDDESGTVELPARLRRQVVSYATREAPGTIIIDTPNTYLYLVMGNGQAHALRHRRRPRRLHLVGHPVDYQEGRVAGLDASAGDDRSASPICRATWPAAPATRLAPAPCISAAPCIASTAPTRRRRSARMYRPAASASPTRTSATSTRRVKVGTKVVVLPMTERRADLGTAVR